MALRVLIVDDHASFRSQARMLLEAIGYEVAGEAEDAAGAVAAVGKLHPDIVVLDVQLPDRDGFSVADEIGSDPGAPRVVLISSRDASDYGDRIDAVPAAGFIQKSQLSRQRLEELVGAPAG